MLLSECIAALEGWSEGGELPAAFVALGEAVLGEGDRDLFAAGAAPLWVLGDRIDPAALDEARLPQEGLAALGLAVLVRGRLLLVARRRDKAALAETAELAAHLGLRIDPRGGEGAERVIGRLRTFRDDLAAEGIGKAATRPLPKAPPPPPPVGGAPPTDRTSVSPIWFVVLAICVVAGLVSWAMLPEPNAGIDPPRTYEQLPVRTVTMSRGRLVVRVDDGWIDRPRAEREEAAIAFWGQVRTDYDDPGIAVEIQDRRTKLLAVVVAGKVTWKVPQDPPDQPVEPR